MNGALLYHFPFPLNEEIDTNLLFNSQNHPNVVLGFVHRTFEN